MSQERKKQLNQRKMLELNISHGLNNLALFTHSLSQKTDFNSFDILSVTRVDSETPYTRQFTHRRVDSQVYRAVARALCRLPLLRRRLKSS